MMNIYAQNGHKVRCEKSGRGGMPMGGIPQAERPVVVPGTVYVVEKTDVHPFRTDVFLQEFPGFKFSSALFEDVAPQDPNDDRRHKDWAQYAPAAGNA